MASSTYRADFTNMPKLSVQTSAATETINVTYELGWWDEGRRMHVADIRSVAKQFRKYLESGYGDHTLPEIMYARSGRATAGLYIGQGLQKEGIGTFALQFLEDNLKALNTTSRNLAVQFCQPDYTNEHIFGFFASSTRTFAPVQQAIRSWANAICLSFRNSWNISSQVVLTSSLVTTSRSNATISGANSMSLGTVKRWPSRLKLSRHSECRTVQVRHLSQ